MTKRAIIMNAIANWVNPSVADSESLLEIAITAIENGLAEADKPNWAVHDSLDYLLTHDEDRWELLKVYCTPHNADYGSAFNEFFVELIGACQEARDAIRKNRLDEEE